MNCSSRPTLITTPPPLKTALSTSVDTGSATEFHLALTEGAGKRRLFRQRYWVNEDPAAPGWRRITFTPGWMDRTPAGAHFVRQMAVCREGEVQATLADLEARYCVHLYALRPLRVPEMNKPDGYFLQSSGPMMPFTHKRGNDFYRGISRHSSVKLADELPLWIGGLKAVAS